MLRTFCVLLLVSAVLASPTTPKTKTRDPKHTRKSDGEVPVESCSRDTKESPAAENVTFSQRVARYASSVQYTQEKVIGAYLQNVILDTDMGWDDVISLCLLIKNPNVQIIGVTVTGLGEAHLNAGVRNARRILDGANLFHVPVFKGAKYPISEDNDPETRYTFKFPEQNFRTVMSTLNFNETDGPLLDYLNFPKTSPIDENTKAWDFMAQALSEQENQITIVSLGGLTNIEQLYRVPNAKLKNIERIVIMGGAVDGVDGNVANLNNVQEQWDQGTMYELATSPEWNMFIDPVAAKLVFENRKNVPLVLVPLNACNHVLLEHSLVDLIRNPDNISQLAKKILEGEIKKEGKLPIFDPLATLIGTFAMKEFSYERKWILVADRSKRFNQRAGTTFTIAADPLGPNAENDFRNVKIVTTASSHEFSNVFGYLINMPSPKAADVFAKGSQGLQHIQMRLDQGKIKKNVALVVFDNIELFDYAGVAQVFDSARNALYEDDTVKFNHGEPAFNVFTVASPKFKKCRMSMSSGDQTTFKESKLTITPDYTFDSKDIPHIDVIVVLGGQGIDEVIEPQNVGEYVKFINKTAQTADYVVGVCSGVLLLAHTQLLNDLEVSTHHARFSQLQNMSDANKWNLRVMDTRLGRNYIHNPISKAMTSGGVHCVIAVALHVVELYMGAEQKKYIASHVMEYQVPIGDFVPPTELEHLYSYNYDPRSFLRGFSHVNVIVPDLLKMEEATDFYGKILGFREAWSVWLEDEANEHFAVDAGIYTRAQIDEMKAKGINQPVKLLVRFLVHPTIQMHIELMMYQGVEELHPKRDPTFLNTYDAGGIRHVALEVDNCVNLWHWLRTFDNIDLLQKESEPEKLHPDVQTFFYFRDPYGVQWEFEQGRPMGLVIKGVIG